MSYKLTFKQDAKKEWDKLNKSIKVIFVKKLEERLVNPHIESARLRQLKDCYKIKLRRAGYRLVYQVREAELIVAVVAVGKRDKSRAYNLAMKRLDI
ncbi:MAG: type II toxin-antitoxin system RelE/ParE family toxin [Candidatus Ruthia sp.]|nr:type II toxin-antitoxin system RelE/ParE family toxin [Candidatus Ruthturnera sp.]